MSARWVQKNDLKMWFFSPNNVIQASQRKYETEKSMQAVTESVNEDLQFIRGSRISGEQNPEK